MSLVEGLFWGMKFSLITSARNVLLLLSTSCVLLVCCVVSTNLLTMAAAGAIWCRHLPNGGIQCLPVKPWMCFIGRCAPRRTAASPWQSKLPAICLHLCSRRFHCRPQQWLNNIVIINLNQNKDVELFITMLLVYSYCLGTRRQRWMPFWPPFLAAGERFVENKMSSIIKLISLLFYQFI
jgi:hypothetical protein